MWCTLCTKRDIPCICSLTTTNACDAFQQAHKKWSFVVRTFQPQGQRSSRPRRPHEHSFVVSNDESIPKREWIPGPQTGQQEQFWTISPSPSSITLSTPLLGHHPMVTSLPYWSKVIIWPMTDGNGDRTLKLGPIVTMSFHPLDSNAKNKTHQIPPGKTHPFHVCLASKPHGNPLQAQVAPDVWMTYPANPPNTMSHLFLARVHPSNHLRTFQLVSQNMRWLQRNPRRNILLSHHFSFFTPINSSSPLL
ncbi:hypothetical protein O181_021009 [Austropuccinia psidii MF-1]|uniref:Uncharacterized protein n=1 Tax=Austropuccinia psidii MF-1 TaxID=1389203 RepID=A0A9Q3CCC9_9BASI|nr:hypothetical protein [Austropuccinia psidii MF-1]